MADEVFLGGSFGLVLLVVAIEMAVVFFPGFSGEEKVEGKESVFDGILGGALFAFFGARST
jgi:hypothetical protein